MSDFLSVYITATSKDEAEKIAVALVEEHLVACVNIFPNVVSVYRWKGQTERAEELVLIAKTTTEKFDAIEKRIKEIHSYECPCIVAVPLAAGSKEYLEWIKSA